MKNKYLKLIFFVLFVNIIFFISNVEVQADTIYDNSVNLQKKIITLREGQETSIWSSSEDENNIYGKYYSKNMKIAAVDKTGKIKAKMVGVTSIVYINQYNK